MFVARNEDGYLNLSKDKPFRVVDEYEHPHQGYWDTDDCQGNDIELDKSLFPQLTWEDEPEEVEIVMKNPLYKEVCPHCGKEFKYHSMNIGIIDARQCVQCPHCKKIIYL